MRREPRLEIHADAEAVGKRAAEVLAHEVDVAYRHRGRACVALSRPTPREAFLWIDRIRFSHPEIDVFQVDERRAPRASDDRNLVLIERHLPSWTPHARLHPMPVDEGSLARGASVYSDDLVSICGDPPVLDVVHLGLGSDGHTASLLPGEETLDVRDAWICATPVHAGHARMTMTYPVLDRARLVVFVVTGEAKARALAGVLAGDPALPAARVSAPDRLFLVDRAAASLVGTSGAG